MKFSNRFLSALANWQRGWREEKARRLCLEKELVAAVQAEELPRQFRTVCKPCYRKRYLVPNNPQNDGDLGPLFLNGFIEEGLASWTIDKKFAQDFKDPLREGTFAAVFAHYPKGEEVLLNIPALWNDSEFVESVKNFHDNGHNDASILKKFKDRQGEIIMNAKLCLDDLIAVCGRSSPFDVLCELAGLRTDEERDSFWQQLVDADKFPEEPMWLSADRTKVVLNATREKFLKKHSDKIEM